MIQVAIRKLIAYGIKTGLVPEEDKIYTTNRLLELFGLEELEEPDEKALAEVENTQPDDLEVILSEMLDYAYEAGLMEDNGVVYRDLFDTKIMSVLMPRPSEVIGRFNELYKKSRSEGFGKEVKKRIMLGTMLLSSEYHGAYYDKAVMIKRMITDDFRKIFDKCQIIIAPVAPTVAYKFGAEKDPMRDYLGDIYTVSVNMAGIPALSLPCGKGEDGMPVGMQLIGPAFSEALLYRAGYAYENRGKADVEYGF